MDQWQEQWLRMRRQQLAAALQVVRPSKASDNIIERLSGAQSREDWCSASTQSAKSRELLDLMLLCFHHAQCHFPSSVHNCQCTCSVHVGWWPPRLVASLSCYHI
jgi:hypothetical protein